MPYIMMGLFAFLIAIVSLWRIMSDREFYRLTMMKRAFGRSRGLAVHFVVAVALPVIFGIVFLTGGIVGGLEQHPLQPEPAVTLQPEEGQAPAPLPNDYLCFS